MRALNIIVERFTSFVSKKCHGKFLFILIFITSIRSVSLSQTCTQLDSTHFYLNTGTYGTLVLQNSGFTKPNDCGYFIKDQAVYVCLNMGRYYKFGNAVFNAVANITINGYQNCSTPVLTVQFTTNIMVDDTVPLTLFKEDITKYNLEKLTVTVNSITFKGGLKERDSLQVAFYTTTDQGYDVSNVKVTSKTITVSNPTTFSWGTTCSSVPQYELQVLRLFNIDSTNAWTSEALVKAIVDWSQAEDIVTGNSDSSYTMTLAEGRGYYLWRVRPIGSKYPGGYADSRNYGNWSTGAKYSNNDTVINITTSSPPFLFFYYQFNDTLNWIYSRTFTEGDQSNGKTRMWEKMDFATGLLQMRQEQALLQSQKQVLTDETLYDYSGRAAIKTLAAPVNVDSLGYIKGFIQGAANVFYNPTYFDRDGNYLSPSAVTGGALNTYYSNSNSNIYIPGAEGYPYSRSRYEPDGTGRVIEQGGPGGTYHLKLSNTHTTRTYYGSVADIELIRIFGDEAPRDTTTYKVLNVDGNNTVTVSYIDKEGKTIATCMSSGLDSTGSILDVLPEQANGRFTVNDTVYNHYGGPPNQPELIGSKTLALAAPTQVTFRYEIHPGEISNNCPAMCNRCDYEVTFNLRTDTTSLLNITHIIAADTCSHKTGWDTTFSITLSPGQYTVEKSLQGNIIDPKSTLPFDSAIGITYEQEQLDTLHNRYMRVAAGNLDSVDYFLQHSQMSELYTYLHINTSVNNPDSVFADSSVAFNIGCGSILIPISVCPPANNCSGNIPNFEAYFKSIWIDSTSFWGTTGGYLNYLNTSPDNYTPGQFNYLIHNMLLNGYTCDSLWNCWKSTVLEYASYRQLARTNSQFNLNLVKIFLDCTGRKYKGSCNGVSDTALYRGKAFEYFYNKNDIGAGDTLCYHAMKLTYGDTTTWGQDSLHGQLTNKKWEQFYDCIWFTDDNVYANNNDTSGNINGAECTCISTCEQRYDGFVMALIQMYHNDSIYVEGDKYYLVRDTSNDGFTYVPGLTLLPNMGITYKSMSDIRCAARDLVSSCEGNCNQTVYRSNGHIDSVGNVIEHNAALEAMTYSYTLSLAPCGPGATKVAPMPSDIKIWDHGYGGDDTDQLWDITQDTVCVGSYLLAGWINGIHGDVTDSLLDTVSYWAVKVNQAGSLVWNKTYAGKHGRDYLRAVVQMPDGGYMLGGYSNSAKGNRKHSVNFGGYDYWIVKTDDNGNEVWDSTYGGNKDDILQSIHRTRDNNYLLIGYTKSGATGNKSSGNSAAVGFWVVKIDGTGHKLWDKTYYPIANSTDTSYGEAAVEMANGNYLIGGSSNIKEAFVAGGRTGIGYGLFDYWAIETDKAGDSIRSRYYGGPEQDYMYDIAPYANAMSFLLVGTSNGWSTAIDSNERHSTGYGLTDVWIVKVDTNTLNNRADRTFGGDSNEGTPFQARYVRARRTNDSNFIIGVTSNSPVSGTKTEGTYGKFDYWAVKISKNGVSMWDYDFGGTKNDFCTAIDQDPDGYYWIAGYSFSDSNTVTADKSSPLKTASAKSNYWVIKAQESCTHDTICLNWVKPNVVGRDTIRYAYITCDSANASAVYNSIWTQVQNKIDSATALYGDNYDASCGNIKAVQDTFCLSYSLDYFHYTLYDYDRAGNLVRTVPPKGTDLSITDRLHHPADSLVTLYWYNSLHQLIKQQTPDGGVTYFYYDYKGELRFSQNAKQRQLTTPAYSYTKYDQLGRVIEVGQSTDSLSFMPNKVNAAFFPFVNNSQRTYTVYSVPAIVPGIHGDYQSFLQNRVSFTHTDDTVDTYYSYDPHGNVKWLVQNLPGDMGEHYLNYTYDQLSNKVLGVKYDSGAEDAFYHRYYYDADQRLVTAQTTKEMEPSGEIGHNLNTGWDVDGYYKYYLHGPLQRIAIGQDSIQGLDNVYTLEGWLKGVNYPTLSSAADPGGDGGAGRSMPTDLFGMTLGYDDDDFNRSSSEFLPTASNLISSNGATSFLYNGNISTWTENIKAAGGGNKYEQLNGYQYRYDQLNRITKGVFRYNGGSWTMPADSDYLSRYTYGANGNFNTLSRNAYDNPSPYSAMDYLKYHFNKGTNQLNYVTDTVRANKWSQDIDNESPNNYLYDSIGELTKDTANGIKLISWTVYGKVQGIKKYNGDSLHFTYDAMQNRIEKLYIPNGGSRVATFYERDAQGNIITTYSRTEDATYFYFTQTEEPIYGSDRLGEFKENIFVKSDAKANYGRGPFWMPVTLASQSINIVPFINNVGVRILSNGLSHFMQVPFYQRPVTLYTINVPNTTGHFYRKINDKIYELKDHLGDVRVTVADRKDSLDNPNMLSYNNNYAFGMAEPSRAFNLGSYRFGFNTQEMDNEIYGNANAYTAEFWEYDPRVASRWNTDIKIDPTRSIYSCFTGNPIWYSDVKGDTVRVAGEVKIGPPTEFAYETRNNINMLRTTSEGEEAYDQLQNSKNDFTIKPIEDNPNNREEFVPNNTVKSGAIKITTDPELTQQLIGYASINYNFAEGSGGTIYYSTDPNSDAGKVLTQNGYIGEPFINLAHELFGHGGDADKGLADYSSIAGLQVTEWRATHKENQIRSALGLPLRTFYGVNNTIDNSGNVIDRQGENALINGNTSLFIPNYDYRKENPPSSIVYHVDH